MNNERQCIYFSLAQTGPKYRSLNCCSRRLIMVKALLHLLDCTGAASVACSEQLRGFLVHPVPGDLS